MAERADITRLAPSPTGALHLGNAYAFLVAWGLARARGWRVALRIEDLDGPRIKPGAAEQICDTLTWLGLDWDGPVTVQSQDLTGYWRAMERLANDGCAYPCVMTRSEIDSAMGAPQEGSGETRFAAELRPRGAGGRWEFIDGGSNWRFVTPDVPVRFDDGVAGPQEVWPSRSIGDFVLWTRRACPSYQLAVVVDDAAAGVTQVVRGNDLIDSAGRQLLLYRALGLGPEPTYWHLPLVVGPDGRRLAKRHGDTRVEHYRSLGVPAEAVIGLAARWCGFNDDNRPMSAVEFSVQLGRGAISPGTTPRVFHEQDDEWLISQA